MFSNRPKHLLVGIFAAGVIHEPSDMWTLDLVSSDTEGYYGYVLRYDVVVA